MTTSYNPQYDDETEYEEPAENDTGAEEKHQQQIKAQSLSVSPKTKSNSLIHYQNRQKNKTNISTVEKIISITPTCYLKPKAFV